MNKKIEARRWAMLKRLKAMAKVDSAAEPLVKVMEKLWTEAHAAMEEAALAKAERDDRGEVLLTIYFPKSSAWSGREVIQRTPNRLIRSGIWYGTPGIACVRNPESAWVEMAREWLPGDPIKMAERAALVAMKPREFWCYEEEEA
jgi:hypothetical protein